MRHLAVALRTKGRLVRSVKAEGTTFTFKPLSFLIRSKILDAEIRGLLLVIKAN